jgi:hypothetical protein
MAARLSLLSLLHLQLNGNALVMAQKPAMPPQLTS